MAYKPSLCYVGSNQKYQLLPREISEDIDFYKQNCFYSYLFNILNIIKLQRPEVEINLVCSRVKSIIKIIPYVKNIKYALEGELVDVKVFNRENHKGMMETQKYITYYERYMRNSKLTLSCVAGRINKKDGSRYNGLDL